MFVQVKEAQTRVLERTELYHILSHFLHMRKVFCNNNIHSTILIRTYAELKIAENDNQSW